ncbi:MAG TPA: hypothetical protein VES65_09320 [Solirubrobacteraceae bacterium]|nr:hypothetical protein [Solirubrobacteraceae bacterium]
MVRPSHGAWRAALASLTIAGALCAATPAAAATRTRPPASSLLQSRELWATVDVCNPPDERNTVGIRGSMPGDGRARDTMYMRFQLQYLQAKGGWASLARDGDSGFIALGGARTTRQGGTSFQLMGVKGRPAYTLRGVVTFQWRRGARVLHEVTRTTTAGHRSAADADPPGYSTAQCRIG